VKAISSEIGPWKRMNFFTAVRSDGEANHDKTYFHTA